MKAFNIKSILGALVLAAMVSSCAISYPVCVTANKSVKEGRASVKYVFCFGPMHADLSIKTAAENGGITKVSTVDMLSETKALGFILKYTTIVTGE
jgi:hypothetical protein